jgi:hypothetical protein
MADVLSQIMADKKGTLQKLLDLEKIISWSRYYWKGSSINLLTVSPSYYDPRTFEEYIEMYNSDLTNYFIFADIDMENSVYKKGNINDCDVMLFNDPNWKTGSYINFDRGNLAFLSGIIWFEKEELLFNYVKARYGKDYFTEETLNNIKNNYVQYMDVIRYYNDKLAEIMPLTAKMFYCSPLQQHLWQLNENNTLIVEWNNLKDEYDNLQMEIMKALANIPSLNICANIFNASSMNVSGTANINMAANCVSSINGETSNNSSVGTEKTKTSPLTGLEASNLQSEGNIADISASTNSSRFTSLNIIIIIIICLICYILISVTFLFILRIKGSRPKSQSKK